MVGQRAAELGLPAALVRMDEEPPRQLQRAILGFLMITSLGLAITLLLAAFVVAPALGEHGRTFRVIAIATSAIPFYAARAIPMALMERQLRFGRVAVVETADTLAFNGFALLAALAGLGAFSLSGAVAVGAISGMGAAWALQPFARRPSLNLSPVRPLIGFGVQVSLLQGVYLLRELGFVTLVAGVGGTSAAGFYAMAKRLFSFPIALTSAVGRVSFPALSREPEKRYARAAAAASYTAIAAGLPLALVAGAIHPLINVVLGSEWQPTADIVLLGSLGMMLIASADATMVSLALAEGKPSKPLGAAIAETTVSLALVAILIGPMNEAGIGLTMTVSAIVATVWLAWKTHPSVVRSLGAVAKASVIAAIAAGAGQLAGSGESALDLILSLTAVTVVWVALEAIFSRADMTRIFSIVRPLLRRALPV
jgi:PST family polysaccharide transporter